MSPKAFPANQTVFVILPSLTGQLSLGERQHLENIPKIFKTNESSLLRQVGGNRLEFTTLDPGHGSRWYIGPKNCNPCFPHESNSANAVPPPLACPSIFLDRKNKILITDAPDAAGIWETFSWFQNLSEFPDGLFEIKDCADVDSAIDRIVSEVECTYPSFELRNLNWNEIAGRFKDRVRQSNEPMIEAQKWLAELQDAHTWVISTAPRSEFPYEIFVQNGTAFFSKVPDNSAACLAGVRTGDQLIDDRIADWTERTAATPHSKPLVIGKRLMTDLPGASRKFFARTLDGRILDWAETAPSDPWSDVFTWRRLESGTGYIKIRAWMKGKNFDEIIDQAFADFKDAPGLIIDLRTNGGGDVTLAENFRSRFLRAPAELGSVRYCEGAGQLSSHVPILGEPASAEKLWTKPVRILTNPLTYSASEDFMLGLQGLPHVRVIGENSGGGSGRARAIRLMPGWRLTVSTALTFDRTGRCVEGNGIPVDDFIAIDRTKRIEMDAALIAAERGWTP